jgi:hypothetical protein
VFAVVSHLTATARLVRRVALCNSSMSVITQMLQRVVTMAQTAMAVVDNHRDAARTRGVVHNFLSPRRIAGAVGIAVAATTTGHLFMIGSLLGRCGAEAWRER